MADSLADAICADILRELAYCKDTPGFRFARGQVARAQAEAIERGWIEPLPDRPQYLRVTMHGHRVLHAARDHLYLAEPK